MKIHDNVEAIRLADIAAGECFSFKTRSPSNPRPNLFMRLLPAEVFVPSMGKKDVLCVRMFDGALCQFGRGAEVRSVNASVHVESVSGR